MESAIKISSPYNRAGKTWHIGSRKFSRRYKARAYRPGARRYFAAFPGATSGRAAPKIGVRRNAGSATRISSVRTPGFSPRLKSWRKPSPPPFRHFHPKPTAGASPTSCSRAANRPYNSPVNLSNVCMSLVLSLAWRATAPCPSPMGWTGSPSAPKVPTRWLRLPAMS